MVVELPVSAEEVAELARMRRRLRRNGVILIVVLDLLVIAVGLGGVADLRRMSTPSGAAAAWADAASAGDCDRYLDLETPVRRAADLAGIALTPQLRSRRAGLCGRVATAWSGFSSRNSAVVSAGDGYDVVRLTVAGATSESITGEVLMSHAGGRWRVDRPVAPCVSPAYSPAQSLCPHVALP